MNVRHHVSDELLMSYAAGGLSEAWLLAIATHAALCPQCRDGIAGAEAIGGSLIEDIEPVAMPETAFSEIMNRLDGKKAPAPSPAASVRPFHDAPLPEPLRSYIARGTSAAAGELPWQRLGLSAYHIPIPTEDRSAAARLLRIPAGRPVPAHSHGGLELTLVLSGAFTDGDTLFSAGDFQEADQSVTHQPHAVPGEDCICLAVTDAPLRFKSPIVSLIQPLLGI